MSRAKCNVCAGEYDDPLPDGSRYFHRCPPYSVVELKAAIAAGVVSLTPGQQALFDKAALLDLTAPLAKEDVPRTDRVLGTLGITRPGARDENIRGFARAGKPDDPIADGIGKTTIAAANDVDRKF